VVVLLSRDIDNTFKNKDLVEEGAFFLPWPANRDEVYMMNWIKEVTNYKTKTST